MLAEERQRQAQKIAHLRRAVIRAVPETEAPGAIALVAIGTRSIRTCVGGELAGVVDVLAEFDVLIGLHVRETLHGVGVDPDRWRLVDLKPPQKSRRLNRRGRTLQISPELLISSTTGISRPLGDPAKVARYLAEALAQFLAEQQRRLAPQTFAQDVTKKLAAWLAEKGCPRADEAEDATERIHDRGRDDSKSVVARGFAARIQDDCNA